jgi:hypothetical protein
MSQAQKIADQLRKELAHAAKSLTLEIDKELRKATPVDTGHARASWVPSATAPGTDRASGLASVVRYSLDVGPLWVSTNVPYMRRLNYGHSKQAPAGFIERSVDLALRTIEARYQGRVDVSDMTSRVRSSMGAEGAENMASAYSPFGGDE